jgi:hypothetical protein
MTKTTQKVLFLLLSLLPLSVLAHGQNIPAVTTASPLQGFSLPDTAGSLTYGITGSESARIGYYNDGTIWNSTISGDLGYLSRSTDHPFRVVYSGGLYYSTGGEPSNFFQNLLLSQTFNIGRWNYTVSDGVRYLPESPSVGLSGVPGVGDVGVPTPPDPDDDILSNFGARLSNSTSGTVGRQLTGSTDIHGSGNYTIQRFIGGTGGLDLNSESGSGGVTHRIDALNSLQSNYAYSQSSYPSQQFSFTTQTLTAGYTRQMSRQLTVSASAGPQRTSSSNSALPKGLGVSVDASLIYTSENSATSLTFARGVRTGSGVVEGGVTDTTHFIYSRTVGRSASVSATASYAQQDSTPALTVVPFSTRTVLGSLQGSRAVGRYLSGYISYTLLDQSLHGSATASNGFSGISQIVAIGITYSPRPIHFGQ